MRISDWSSDVCSSDLGDVGVLLQRDHEIRARVVPRFHRGLLRADARSSRAAFRPLAAEFSRSDEAAVGLRLFPRTARHAADLRAVLPASAATGRDWKSVV